LKFHLNLIKAVNTAVYQIFEENRYADKALERLLKSDKRWGARDRAFIAENTYEMVRHWRLIRTCSGLETHELNETNQYTLFGTWQVLKGVALPKWEEFKNVDAKKIEHTYNQIKTQRKVLQSYPDWMDKLLYEELGKQWNIEAEALNEPASLVIRVNLLKTTKDKLVKIFQEKDIKVHSIEGCKDGLRVDERQNLFLLPEFKEGLFEVQDASSQLVVPFLQVEPGMRVIDACAGAGGKTLHLASVMANKGRIISMDTEAWKLDELKKRGRRAGVSTVEPRLIEGPKTIKKLQHACDRLLLDVPCSGMGVIRRNPDAKWKLDMSFIERLQGIQAELLDTYSIMVKPGGKMVYATCSILPRENEKQVQAFLERNSDFELEESRSVLPSESGFDGFYMARMIRKA